VKVLVTGTSGRIGSAIAARLALRHRVTGVDHRPGALTAEVADVRETARLAPLLAGGDAVEKWFRFFGQWDRGSDWLAL